jgi:hypothetical protein
MEKAAEFGVLGEAVVFLDHFRDFPHRSRYDSSGS